MFASAAVLLVAAASPALGNLFMTSPVAASSWQAGQEQTISWKDDGSAPSLADLGPCKVSVFVGSQTQQTLIQEIVPSVDVSTTSSIVFTPDASKGESGPFYFIRVESLGLKDAKNPQFPAQAFSSKFTLNGMTGTFDANVKAQIGDNSSGGGSSAAAAGSPTQTSQSSAAAGTKAAATTSHAPSSSTTKAVGDADNNGAVSVSSSAIACLAGVAAVAFTMLF